MESRPCLKLGHLGRGWADSAGPGSTSSAGGSYRSDGQGSIALAVGGDGGCLDIYIH